MKSNLMMQPSLRGTKQSHDENVIANNEANAKHSRIPIYQNKINE